MILIAGSASDLPYRLICTEKDAVKLWKQHPDALAVPLQPDMDPAFLPPWMACWPMRNRRSLSSPS
jgi:tetraacyldisaccharide 4'-kinase